MAAESDVVRISHQELQDIVKERVEREIVQEKQKLKEEAKRFKDEELLILEAKRLKEEERRLKHEERKKKRPTVGIYRPPSIIRHKQKEKGSESSPSDDNRTTGSTKTNPSELHISEEDWDSEVLSSEPTSKENSVEKEMEEINSGVKNMNVSPHQPGKSKPGDDSKRRSKRPEIQRYVPKGRQTEKQNPDLSGEGSGDLDLDSSPSPTSAIHSPSPGPGKVPHSPSPRKVDLKNMQVTVVNNNKTPTESQQDSINVKDSEQISGNPGKLREQTGGYRGRGRGHSYSRGRGQRLNQKPPDKGRGHFDPKVSGDNVVVGSRGNSREKDFLPGGVNNNKNRVEKDSKDMYIVPSRPNTIGQEAQRVDTIGSDSKQNQGDELTSNHDNHALLSGLSNRSSGRNKSRSFDRLNQAEKWEEEGYFPDSDNLGTLIFERSRSSEQLNLSGKNALKPPVPRSSSGGNKPGKKYPFQSTRPRRDSFSSDISTGTGSDWSTEDLDFDKEVDDKKVDWTEEVDTQLALQVQDETQKMNAWFARQESGGSLSQSADCLDQSNNALDSHSRSARTPDWDSRYYSKQSDMSSEKSNTLPFTHRRKHTNVDTSNQLRGRNVDRRKGSLGFRSRDSSVSSVQSCQSVQSVQSAYGSEGRRRRRRRRKSSAGSHRSGSMEAMNIQVTCGGQSKREVTVDPKGRGPEHFGRMNSFEKRDKGGEDWNRRGDNRKGREQYRGDKGFGSREDIYYGGQKDSWQRGGDKLQKSGRHGQQDRGGHKGDQDRFYKQDGGYRGDRKRQDSGGSKGDQDRFYKQDGGYRGDRKRRDSGGSKGGDQRYRHDSGEHYRQEGGSGHRGGWRQNRQGGDRSERGGRGRDEGGYSRYSQEKDVRRHPDNKSSQNAETERSHHGGGIIHLPPKSKTPDPHTSDKQTQEAGTGGGRDNWSRNHPAQHSGGNWNKEANDNLKGASRRHNNERHHSGGRQKTLFDPNNPSKPIVIEEARPKLDFKDPDHMYGSSPQSPQYPPSAHSPHYPPGPPSNPQQLYSPGSPNYGQFYPPGYGYGYNMPPPPHPMAGMMAPPPGHEGMYYGYPPQGRDWNMYPEDPYNQGMGVDSEVPMAGDRSRSQCRMIAEQILRESIPMEKQLNALIMRRIGGDNTVHMINQLRGELQRRFEQLILLDPDLANKQNVEQMLWKSVFYHMVELLRRQLSEHHDADTGTMLNKVLNEGTTFYENLLEKLQTTFNFKLDTFLDPNTLPPDTLNRTTKLALLSAQRTMICLGDIARYKEQRNDGGKVNYGKARSWYTKAQQIDPKNGRPYNQLAILALYTKRKLDAVYYYMRSLAARNPFITARESLMSLFDEARKKFVYRETCQTILDVLQHCQKLSEYGKAEEIEKKRIEERKKQHQIKKARGLSKHRVEIWIKNDGTSSESKLDNNYDEDLSKLDPVQLNKRFVLSFLNVHGKLFTKIGMETFEDSCGAMLMEFKVLLKDNAITPLRLLQLMAINMFAIENTALKDESLESTCKSLLQQHSVQLGLDMFGIMIERCSQLLQEHIKSSDYPSRLLCRELEELIPGVKVWIGWMMGNPDLWNPPPSVRDPSMGPEIDVWSSTAKLCNILKEVDISDVDILRDKTEDSDVVILSEDTMMAGFVPLLSTPYTSTMFVDKTVDKELARDCLRLSKLKLFEQYLCGIDPPMLAYDGTTKLCFSIAPSQGYDDLKKEEEEKEEEDSEDDIVIEGEEEIIQEEGVDDDHVQQLLAKREELKKKMEENIRQKENRKKMLESNRHRSIEIEIRPIFLVPDTNCFIDHLPSMQKLIRDKQYTIVIPLVVINELDGLAQGQKQHGQYDSEEHAVKVKTYAKKTVTYLEEEFDKKNSHLKALTSKGSVMETISFRSEETDRTGNNDDLILSCCTYYCKDKARDFMPKDKDAPVRLYREVVLLTDDRNLRLKAHTHNVPVKELPAFMRWSSGT